MKLKRYLIHLLGGLTIEESKKSDAISLNLGRFATLVAIRIYAESLNGMAADEWCKSVYQYICDKIDEMPDGKEEAPGVHS